MADKDEAAIAEMEKQVEELSTELEKVIAVSQENSIEKASVPQLREALKKAKAKLPEDLKDGGADDDEEDAKGQVKKLQEEIAILKVVASMTQDEKDHCSDMSGGEKNAFMAKPKDERQTAMKKRVDADEVIKVEGQEIRKSVVGESQFNIFKAQDARIKKQDEDIAKERDAREMAEFSKRAGDEYPHVPGEVSERAAMLKALSKMDEPLRNSFEAVLTQSEKLAKASFETVGHQGGKDNLDKRSKNGITDFEKRVDEIVKSRKLSKSEAMSKARLEYPDDFKKYQDAGN